MIIIGGDPNKSYNRGIGGHENIFTSLVQSRPYENWLATYVKINGPLPLLTNELWNPLWTVAGLLRRIRKNYFRDVSCRHWLRRSGRFQLQRTGFESAYRQLDRSY